MADSSSPADSSQLLAQILSMLQSGKSGTPPTAPNQATNSQGQTFQLGAGGQATPENPGSSPDASLFNSATATSLPTSGMSDEALQNWYGMNQGKTVFGSDGNMVQIPSMSGGGSADQGNSYGMAAPSQGGTPEPGTIRAWMNAGQNGSPSGVLNGASLTNPQSAQFNQLIQQFKDAQAQPPTAPAPQTAPPLPPTVPNNQVAYTDPSKAVIPGMGAPSPVPTLPQAPAASLPAQLQQGMTQKDIIAQGGPLQASTDTSTNLPQYNTVNQQVVNGQMEAQPSVGSQPNQGGGAAPDSSLSTMASGLTAQTQPVAVQSSVPPEHAHLGSDFQSYAPASTKAPPAQSAQQLESSDPSMQGVNTSAQAGNYNALNPATSSTTPGNNGVLNTESDPDPDPGLEGTGIQPSGGMSAGMGSALAKGVGQIGAAISSAYKPIKLPTVQPVQQPKPLTFGAPSMSQ